MLPLQLWGIRGVSYLFPAFSYATTAANNLASRKTYELCGIVVERRFSAA